MKILIVENESYLANSIATKLESIGHECITLQKLALALSAGEFDVVILSASWGSGDVLPIIKKHKNSIIIMLVSYISNDTVASPINAGATDYIQKPFMIEELIKKIEHHAHFRALLRAKECYDGLLSEIYHTCKTPKNLALSVKFPLAIKGGNEISRLAFAYCVAENLGAKILTTNADESDDIALKNEILYIKNFSALSEIKREKLISNFAGKRLVFEVCDVEFASDVNEILLSPCAGENEILSLEEYLKFAILAYQNYYFDSELAIKLGISRKSLWEKRKKYGIARKK